MLVPVNFMLRKDEVAYILRHSGARVLCVDSELTGLGREAASLDTNIEKIVWLPGEAPSVASGELLNFADASV